MIAKPAIYLGRVVDKKRFRTFIYGVCGTQKLVESWSEFQDHMKLGIWFATKEEADACKPVDKPKSKSKKLKVEDVQEIGE